MLNITINLILNRILNSELTLYLLFFMLRFDQVKMYVRKVIIQAPILEPRIIHMQIMPIELNQPLKIFQA